MHIVRRWTEARRGFSLIHKYMAHVHVHVQCAKPQKAVDVRGKGNVDAENVVAGYETTYKEEKAIEYHEKKQKFGYDIGASGTETYMNKVFLCAIDEQYTETKEMVNNPTESRSCSIPPSLTKSLRGIRNVEGFDVIGKNITIHVLQGHTEKAEEDIKNALNKYHELELTYSIEIFQESDCIELHSESVGGQRISRYLADIELTKGTIGCFLKLQIAEGDSENDSNYAVTCHHVARPERGKNSILFKTITNDGESKEFSKKIAWHMLNSQIPVDIALIPVKKPCDAFNFKHNECNKYTCNRENLVGKKVQKEGAKTKLTRGEIVSVNSNVLVTEANGEKCWYGNVIRVESTENKAFSEPGDSGSLVTLSRNTSDETHQAVSIVFAGGTMADGKPVSYSFDFFKAVDWLFRENDIDNKFDILSDSMTAGLHESSDD